MLSRMRRCACAPRKRALLEIERERYAASKLRKARKELETSSFLRSLNAKFDAAKRNLHFPIVKLSHRGFVCRCDDRDDDPLFSKKRSLIFLPSNSEMKLDNDKNTSISVDMGEQKTAVTDRHIRAIS